MVFFLLKGCDEGDGAEQGKSLLHRSLVVWGVPDAEGQDMSYGHGRGEGEILFPPDEQLVRLRRQGGGGGCLLASLGFRLSLIHI